MNYVYKKRGEFGVRWKILTMTAMLVILFIIALIKYITLHEYGTDYLVAIYSLVVASYIFVRFGLSYLYIPDCNGCKADYLPTVTLAIPAKNEEAEIYETIVRNASANYPKDRFEIIVINDGSTDETLREIIRAKKYIEAMDIRLSVVNWEKNKGKREGMAEAVRMTNSEIIIFVDSDSYIENNAIRELVKYFSLDKQIGGVTAHTRVRNTDLNILTKLQTIHYFISFRVFKSTESLFGTVTCCPGCCTAYRVSYIKKDMEEWAKQTFLGVACTFGDDRSLTNFLLKRRYKTILSPTAFAYTIVPDNLRTFFKQQLRWKKSWTRETVLAARFFWKNNFIMVLIFYTGFLLTLMTPIIVIRALIWYPLTAGVLAYSYFIGLVLTSVFFGLYYRLYTGDKKWFVSFLYSFVYSFLLSWQLLYAIPTIRNQSWGTR